MNEKQCYAKLYGKLVYKVDHYKEDLIENMLEKKEKSFFYYNIYLPIYRIWHNNISMWHKEIYWFFQRGFKGYSDRDIWGFDYYLAKIIAKGCKELKKKKLGVPVPSWFTAHRNMTDEEEKRATREWEDALDTIIYAFDMIVKEGDGDVQFYYKGCETLRERLLAKHAELYKDTQFLTHEEQKKINHGMLLFIKHFHDLWD